MAFRFLSGSLDKLRIIREMSQEQLAKVQRAKQYCVYGFGFHSRYEDCLQRVLDYYKATLPLETTPIHNITVNKLYMRSDNLQRLTKCNHCLFGTKFTWMIDEIQARFRCMVSW